jgi:hypothetical protein
MGKYVRHITHKGRDIVFMDTKGANEEEGIAAWEEMRQELAKIQGGHLSLIDATKVSLTPAILRRAKESSGPKAHPDSRTCFVGLTALQKSTAELVARGIHLNMHFCQTLEEGKEWLVRGDDKGHKG